jgi:HNH endonuclease
MGDVASVAEIAERDGRACVWCGREPWERDLTVEHVLPRSRGGRTEPDNLLLACRRCNRRRRSKALGAWLRELSAAGHAPRLDLVTRALDRMATSARPAHRAYAARQRRHLRGLLAPGR